MTDPTQEDRQKASALLDDLTFGGLSQDGAIEVLARALAAERGESRCSTCGQPMASPPCQKSPLTGHGGHTTSGGVGRR